MYTILLPYEFQILENIENVTFLSLIQGSRLWLEMKSLQIFQKKMVLKAVFKYNIPYHWIRLEHLTMAVLIDRLVMRKHFYLAIRICQYLKIPESEGASRILAHWACYKV